MKTLIGLVCSMVVMVAACSVSDDGIEGATRADGEDAGAGEGADVGATRRDTMADNRRDTAAAGPDAPKLPGKIGEICATDDECETRTCLEGVCRMKPENPVGRGNGEACDKADLCKSGFCVDGVCCESACDGACRTCAARGKAGSCTEIAAGQPPARAGLCKDERASCGTTGLCAAGGVCARTAVGALCGAGAICSAAGEMTASRCDAAGMCVMGKAKCAAGFACEAGACLTKCTTDKQCVGGETCAVGVCAPVGALVIPYLKTAPPVSQEAAEGRQEPWLSLSQYPVANELDGAGQVGFGNGLFAASYRVAYTDDALYVWVGVSDDRLVRDSGEQPWHDDCVEIYFDMDLSRGQVYDGKDDYQYLLAYAVDAKDAMVIEQSRRPELERDIQFAYKKDLAGHGYFFLARFPWSALGRPPEPGMRIGFDLQVDDDDNSARRERKLAWWAKVEEAFRNPSYFGTAVLGPKP